MDRLLRLLVVLVPTVGGCAIHVPMSEAVALGAAGTESSPGGPGRGERLEGAQIVWMPVVADSARVMNPNGLGVGVHRSRFGAATGASVSFGAGILGVDVTQKLVGPVYALASGSMLGGSEGFLMARLPPPSRLVSVSAGAGRRCRFDIQDDPDNDSEFVFAIRQKGALDCSIGGRATGLWTTGSANARLGALLGTVYVGISPADGAPTVSVGVASISL